MNTRRMGRLAALSLALYAPMTASAGGLMDTIGGLFGLLTGSGGSSGRPARSVPLSPPVLGHDGLDDEEFPAFGGFRVHGVAEHPIPAMAGMVFRTHRHLVARATGGEGLLEGTPLAVSRPLGSYAEGREAAMLQGIMLKDSLRAAADAGSPRMEDLQGEGDLFDVFLRRLETHTGKKGAVPGSVRELGLQLRSIMGDRRRSVLIYRAERKVQEDGRFWWVADMYDPHMAADEPARLSQLRLRFAEGDRIVVQVAEAWADAAEDESKEELAYDGFSTRENSVSGWVELAAKNLDLVNDDASDLWAPEYIRVDGSDRAAGDQVLNRVNVGIFHRGPNPDGACSGATQEDWSCGQVELGSFDAATPSGSAASD